MQQRVVAAGSITLEAPVTRANIGLPIVGDLQSLPLAFDAQAFGQGRPKNVNRVWLRVFQSSGFSAGPSLTKLTEAKLRTTETFGAPPSLATGEYEIVLDPSWDTDAQFFVRQAQPLPVTLVSYALEASVGG
jgi:hypothetical protein